SFIPWSSSFHFRWKLLQHLLHRLVEFLLVILGFLEKRLFRHSTPDQSLIPSVVHVQHKGSHSVVLNSCRRFSAKSAPAPTSETVIEGSIFLLVSGRAYGCQGNIAVGRNSLPSLGLKLAVNGILDSLLPKRIRGLNLRPVIRVVTLKARLLVVVGA